MLILFFVLINLKKIDIINKFEKKIIINIKFFYLCYNLFFIMIKSINIKNCIIIFIFLMIKSINITKSIICVIIVFLFLSWL